jgi:plastocyanin
LRRRIVPRALAICVLVAWGGSCADSPTEPDDAIDVYTPGNSFSPFSATVRAGGTVRFNIFGDDHDVAFTGSQLGRPENINVVRDTVVARVFSTTGTFPYVCNVHPGMNGQVIVQ